MSNEVAQPVDPVREFQDRVVEKLRKDIGDMLPPEVLNGLAAKALEKSFFEPRVIKVSSWDTRTEPSWFVAEVAKAMEPMMKKCIDDFVEKNQTRLEEAITAFISDQNLTLLAVSAMTSSLSANIACSMNMLADRVTQR